MDYRARKKYNVTMPSHHSQADANWIGMMLSQLSPAHQFKARVGYTSAYKQAFDDEEVPHKKENKARNYANKKLREFRDKCIALYSLESSQKFTGF